MSHWIWIKWNVTFFGTIMWYIGKCTILQISNNNLFKIIVTSMYIYIMHVLTTSAAAWFWRTRECYEAKGKEENSKRNKKRQKFKFQLVPITMTHQRRMKNVQQFLRLSSSMTTKQLETRSKWINTELTTSNSYQLIHDPFFPLAMVFSTPRWLPSPEEQRSLAD